MGGGGMELKNTDALTDVNTVLGLLAGCDNLSQSQVTTDCINNPRIEDNILL